LEPATKDTITASAASSGALPGPLPLSRVRAGWLAAAVVAGAAGLVVWLVAGSGPDRAAPLVVEVPGHPTGVAAVDGEVWVAAQRSGLVWVLDARSGEPVGDPLQTGGAPARLAAGPKGVWVADTARGAVIPVQRRPRRAFPEIAPGADVADVALAARAVWVASSAEDTVHAIEPGGRRSVDLGVGDNPVALASDARRVVAADAGDGTLAVIDAQDRRVVGPPIRVGGVPVAVALAGDVAWVADAQGGAVARVDLRRGARAGAPIPVGPRPVAIAADGDDVYVLCRGDRSLVYLRDGDVRWRRAVGADPAALALDAHHVWVAGAGDDRVMRFDR
jgi:DNA-binding beta-propeller fold protein YncE